LPFIFLNFFPCKGSYSISLTPPLPSPHYSWWEPPELPVRHHSNPVPLSQCQEGAHSIDHDEERSFKDEAGTSNYFWLQAITAVRSWCSLCSLVVWAVLPTFQKYTLHAPRMCFSMLAVPTKGLSAFSSWSIDTNKYAQAY
jgi:hypothetical protein